MYLQGQADFNRVVEGRLGQAGLQALVQAGQQRGAGLSLPAALQSLEHLRSRRKPLSDAAQTQRSDTQAFGAVCGAQKGLCCNGAASKSGMRVASMRSCTLAAKCVGQLHVEIGWHSPGGIWM